MKQFLRHIKRKIGYFKYKHIKVDEKENLICDIGDVKIPYNLAYGKMTRKMYCGVYECGIQWILKDVLNPGGCFVDIGANIGFFTAFALSIVGQQGSVHSFEPVPKYYDNLKKIKNLNPAFNIFINNFALGIEYSEKYINVNSENPGGSSIVKGLFPENQIQEKILIPVKKLDEYVLKNEIGKIDLIKIDTEGYELPVLLGAIKYFEKNINNLPLLIVEINKAAYEPNELFEYLESFGYKPFSIYERKRIDTKNDFKSNLLFVPNYNEARLKI